jgi:hypothetical protein
VCLVVGDSLLVVDAAVQGDVDAEGQESHRRVTISRQALRIQTASRRGWTTRSPDPLAEGPFSCPSPGAGASMKAAHTAVVARMTR